MRSIFGQWERFPLNWTFCRKTQKKNGIKDEKNTCPFSEFETSVK